MPANYETPLYQRVLGGLNRIALIDCHEHLQRERELPKGDDIHIGRFFIHYASCDLVSAGMPLVDMNRVQNDPHLAPKDRFKLIEPWYRHSWNTAYCESIRIALRDIYGFDDLTLDTVDDLTQAMRSSIKPGFTRKVFDRAGIDYALQNPFGPDLVFNPDHNYDCFIVDITGDSFTNLPIMDLSKQSGVYIRCLDDYLKMIDFYFERDASSASALKIGRAYDRPLYFQDVVKSDAEKVFNRLLAFNDRPDRRDIRALEDYILHYLCRKCGEYSLRMKFHTGLQEGNANIITNSRAALMANLFMKYPKTGFDIYHISYPYQEELITLVKNFANVTMDFCWMWIINPNAARRVLSDALDALPVNKIHGFGGDYIFVEGSYGHAVMARQGITRVLCEKVEEGRFSEEYALEVGQKLLRDNAIQNFGLEQRRQAFQKRAGE